jgi:hypothetical protein
MALDCHCDHRTSRWRCGCISYVIRPSRLPIQHHQPPTAAVDLQSYPANVFSFATAVAVFILRRKRRREGLLRPEYHAWRVSSCHLSLLHWFLTISSMNIALIFSWLVNIFLLVML